MTQLAQSHSDVAYSAIGLDQLLTYAVDRVLSRGEDCTFEEIVRECFTTFPQRFGFERFPEWPDSTRVDKSWRRCRTDRGWIVGNVKTGFQITPAGEVVARQVGRQLRGGNGAKEPVKGKARSREAAAVKYVRETTPFQRWTANGNEFIMRFPEFVALLNGTLETPRLVLRQNLQFYKQSAKAVSDEAVSSFLDDCENRFVDLLKEQ